MKTSAFLCWFYCTSVLLLATAAPTLHATTYTWSTSPPSNVWDDGSEWQGGQPPTSDINNTDVVFDSSSVNIPNLQSAYSIHSLTFNAATNGYTFGGSTLTLGVGGITDDSAYTEEFTNVVTLGFDQTWNYGSSANLLAFDAGLSIDGHLLTISAAGTGNALSGVISGNGSLIKSGAGTLTISGANTYSGLTAVTAGTLTLSNGGIIAGDAINVAAGATLNVNSGAAINLPTASADGTSVVNNFTVDGTTTNGASANFNSGSAVTASALRIGVSGSGAVVQTGTANVNIPDIELGINTGGLGTYTLIGGTIGTVNILVGDAGTGIFNQNGGTLTASHGILLGVDTGGNGAYHLNGGTLSTPGVQGLNGQYNPALLQTAQSTAAFYFNGGTLQAAGTTGTTNLAPVTTAFFTGVDLAAIAAGGAIINSNGYNITFAQILVHDPTAGAPAIDGGLTKVGSGTLTLAGAGTFTGQTQVLAGTLDLANPFALSGSTLLTTSNNVTFDSSVVANAFTFGGLAGSGTLTLAVNSGTNLVPIALTVGGNNASTSFSGTLNGPGSLTKVGSGTLSLLSTNSFTGGLTISGGTVNTTYDAGLGAASGSVTLQNSSQLIYQGGSTISRTLYLNDGTVNFGGNTLAGATVDGGYLSGNETVTSGQWSGTTTLPGTTLSVSNGTATLGDVTVRGGLSVNTATASFNNGYVTGAGTVTVGSGGTLNTQATEIQGVTTVNSGGTLAVSGPSLYLTGGSRTTVNSGGTLAVANGTTVELNGSLLTNNGTQTGTLDVNYGSTVKGAGSFGTVNVNDGGVFSPGNSPGTANVQNLSFQSGGSYQFELNSASAANNQPGNSADLISVSQMFSIAAGTTANSRFTIVLVSLDSNDDPAALTDFDPTKSYRFVLVSSASEASGFNAAEFAVNTSGFGNALNGGSFSVVVDGTNLDLVFAPVPEPSTWAAVVFAATGLCLARRLARRVRA
jgi:fibronectin-binding autotransporter adhesin